MLNLFTEIRHDERRETFTAFLTLFGIMAGHALLETARDALFLAQLPPARLAWVYLAIAILAFGIFIVQRKGLETHQYRGRFFIVLCAASAVTFAFWFLVTRPGVVVLYALYVWSGLIATLIIVRLWTYLGELFTVSQAKRLFALIGAGSVLGAIAGSGMARLLADLLEARHILLAASGMFLLTALGPILLLPKIKAAPRDTRPSAGPSAQDLFRPVRTVWSRPYLRRVGGIILVSTLTLTLVDFIFKSSVAENIRPERLGSFFGGAYFAFNIISLGIQLFLVSRLVRSLGVNGVLSVLPALVILGSLGVVVTGGLIAAVLLKAVDGAFRHSLQKTATEVLYVPVSSEVRSRVKGIIDILGQRGGQALGSVFILAVVAIGNTKFILALIVLALAVAWIRIAMSLKVHYLNLFRENLNEVTLRTRFDFPELDLESLESLISSLNSPNDSEVIASLDILAEQDRVRLIPALILYHPSPRVVVRALELFARAGREDFIPLTERLLERPDPEVRAAVLRSMSWVAPSSDLYERFSSDHSPFVRSTALVGMISYGAKSATEAKVMLEALVDVGSEEEKLALARAIRYMPGAAFEDALLKLARSKDPEVRLAVAQAMMEILSPRFIPALLEMLPHRALRKQARTTLVAIGDQALDQLEETLENVNLNRSIRRQLPRAISKFQSEKATKILMNRLQEEPDGAVRYRILRALGRLRATDPTLPLDASALEKALRENLRSFYRLLAWKVRILEGANVDSSRATPVRDGIVALLEHKKDQSVERVFRVLDLLHPGEDMRSIYRGTRSSKRKIRSSSMELLEDLVEPPLRDAVLLVVDDISDAEKVSRVGMFDLTGRADYESVLRDLLESGGVGMRCLVTYHIGELRMSNLIGALETLPSDTGGLVARAVERALEILSPKQETLPHGS
jgi:ATP/ADP translocase/HEAT repeat protein